MVTKGKIIGRSAESNKLRVEIPIFATTAFGSDQGTLRATVLDATVCYDPGNLNGYRSGDVVFVAFEDNQTSKAVILGRL